MGVTGIGEGYSISAAILVEPVNNALVALKGGFSSAPFSPCERATSLDALETLASMALGPWLAAASVMSSASRSRATVVLRPCDLSWPGLDRTTTLETNALALKALGLAMAA